MSASRRPRSPFVWLAGGLVVAGVLAAFAVSFGPGDRHAAAAARPPATVTVYQDPFDTGKVGTWVPHGDAKIDVISDPEDDVGGGVLLVSNISHPGDGAALDLSTLGLDPGVQYSISYVMSVADQESQQVSSAHFVMDDGNGTWISGPRMLRSGLGSYTALEGTFTPSANAKSEVMYLQETTTPYQSLLLADVKITGPAPCVPKAEKPVLSAGFDDKALDGLQQVGNVNSFSYEKVDGDSSTYALRVNGRTGVDSGVQTAQEDLAFSGDPLAVSARVRLATPTRATTTMRLVATPDDTVIAEEPVSAAGWTTLTATYTRPDDVDLSSLQFHIVGDDLSDGTASYDYYVDDVTVKVPAVVCPPPMHAPTITTQPASATARSGAVVTFTAAADAQPAATVAWQRRAPNQDAWVAIPRATGATLTVRALPVLTGTQYRAVFTNTLGSATTDAATLTVTGGAPRG